MSIQMYKNGNVKTSSFNETNAFLVNTFTSEGYTPTTAQNSTMGRNVTGFEAGKEYYIDMTVTWSGFKADAPSNFGMWAQGATYNGTSWVWTIGNPMTSAIGNFTSLMLSVDSGSKRFIKKFTASYTGYQLGCRSDYSNGKGAINYLNIRIIPADKYVNGTDSSGRILTDSIAMDNFIEN